MEPRLIYITCPNRQEALQLAQAVVVQRLAACANILDGMTSVYWWDGQVQEDQECVLIFKTQAPLVDELIAKVRDLHSYEVPAILSLPILKGNPDYLQWIGSETSEPPTLHD
jgi:periplasmic divalent cation tolerance protein